MLHQTFLFLGQLWQLFEVSQILEFLRYIHLFSYKRRAESDQISAFFKRIFFIQKIFICKILN